MDRGKDKRWRQTAVLLFTVVVVLCAFGARASNIDPDSSGCKYAWAENAGWINFNPALGPGVTITDTTVTGLAWGENIGWINLSPASYGGVMNDGTGILSGDAWGENVGWIKFNPAGGGVSIGSDGTFTGYAWGENIGWINFGSLHSCVKTAWAASPELLIDRLINTVNDLDLKQGITTSLDAKLQAAQAALDAVRANDKTNACNLINAFTNEVSAQSGKMITPDQAGQLMNACLMIKKALGCL